MSEAGEDVEAGEEAKAGDEVVQVDPARAVVVLDPGLADPGRADPGRAEDEWADFRPLFSWVQQRRPVLVAGIALIVAQLGWRAVFLGHLYFHQDDFFNLDLARQSSLSWHYLTFIGVGHFMIGQRILAWLIVRSSVYSWGLASAVNLILVACTDLAALRLLRKLFGERPAILVLLTGFLLSPLTLSGFGYWTAATESIPFQLAILMALHAHVCYVRSGGKRHLAAAGAWVAFGLIFYEKGLVLPLLLFAVTAGFLTDRRPVLAGLRQALVRYRRAWVLYVILLAVYGVLLAVALGTAVSKPRLPTSAASAWTYFWDVIRDTLLPGVIGGPWQWLKASAAYALAAPPGTLAWLAIVIVLGVVAASLWRRGVAWRAWAILAGWVVAADMLPVLLRQVDAQFSVLLALDTRYLADASVVLAICLGLAFLPLADENGAVPAALAARDRLPVIEQQILRAGAAGLVAVFVIGSLWSAQSYANATSGAPVSTYIGNATGAIQSAPRGTSVVASYVPASVFVGFFEKYGLTSTVIGDIDPGRLHWIQRPDGTLDNLRIFDGTGQLQAAFVYGASSGRAPGVRGCWATRRGRIVIKFLGDPPFLTTALRIGYIWGGTSAAVVNVQYGGKLFELAIRPGLHAAYLPVTGRAKSIIVTGMDGTRMCVGDAEAGSFAPVAPG